MKKRWMKILFCTIFAALLVPVFAVPAMATGDVAGAIQSTWTAALFFVKVGGVYFDYRKHGQIEFTAPAILFACLIFTLTAPLYIWSIL